MNPERIDYALKEVFSAEASGPQAWQIKAAGHAIKWRCEDNWLRMASAPLPFRVTNAGDAWELLRRNRNFSAPLKFALAGGTVSLALEIPATDDDTLWERLRGIRRELGDALSVGQTLLSAEVGDQEIPPQRFSAQDIARACTQSGWAARPAGDGASVDLRIPGEFCLARIDAGGTNPAQPLRVHAVLNDAAIEGICGHATAVFLLRASARFRFARAAAETLDGEPQVYFEAPLFAAPAQESAKPRAPEPQEFDLALSALKLACGRSVKEVRALKASAELAQEYLRRCGLTGAGETESRLEKGVSHGS